MPNMVKDTQVLYDAHGKKTHVLIPYKKYQRLLEELEDAHDLRLMKEVRHEPDISLEEVKKRLKKRKR